MASLSSVLVANRGEIARRVLRTARAQGLRSVAVCSEADRLAPYVREATSAVVLRGTTAADTYLNIEALVEAAQRTGVEAVHPGYGFLAENANFAKAVVAAGLVFVGPSPDVIRQMGSKVESKAVARAADVPVLLDAIVAEQTSDEELLRNAAGVGFPLLVKASAGGGGRGMRLISSPDEVLRQVAAARAEAASAFGDGTVFLERYLPTARHVEVQLVADRFGTVLHLGDRECSVQRRHQKLLEEAPAVCIPNAVRQRIAEASVRLAEKIGYEGVGTCEFLVSGDDAFFLEMNTRLQVEHTVTEEVTGLDLVALQLQVAAGRPLELTQEEVLLTGVAIEARLCAEDVSAGWVPSVGVLWRYEHDGELRYEDGVASGSVITPLYDSMVAKVIARGKDRAEALRRLAGGLDRLEIGGVTTNRDALVAILRSPDYLAGQAHIRYIDDHPEVLVERPVPEEAAVAAVVAVLVRETELSLLPEVVAGWRPAAHPPTQLVLETSAGDLEVAVASSGAQLGVAFAGSEQSHMVEVLSHAVTGDEVSVVLTDGQEVSAWRVACAGRWDAERALSLVVSGQGRATALCVRPRFASVATAAVATGPVSRLPGTVVDVHVNEGQQVAEGDVLLVIEAMKMQHSVLAPAPGVVRAVLVAVGHAVDAHQILVEFDQPEDA